MPRPPPSAVMGDVVVVAPGLCDCWPYWFWPLVTADDETGRLAELLVVVVDDDVVLGVDDVVDDDAFFHGWKPLPTAASANGGGLFDESLLHWAASMASGVPRSPGCS